MRPKHYPYSRNQWETKTTVLYDGDNREYHLSRKVNRITGEVKLTFTAGSIKKPAKSSPVQ